VRELPGFNGYYLIDAGEGVFASISLFDQAKTAHESTRFAARWVPSTRDDEPSSSVRGSGYGASALQSALMSRLLRPLYEMRPMSP
jgi:hypothetical protein